MSDLLLNGKRKNSALFWRHADEAAVLDCRQYQFTFREFRALQARKYLELKQQLNADSSRGGVLAGYFWANYFSRIIYDTFVIGYRKLRGRLPGFPN